MKKLFGMKSMKVSCAVVSAAMAVALTGCGIATTGSTVSKPQPIAGAKLSGSVFGGQQPIAGSAIHIYAASTAGYGAANVDLLTQPVFTDANGNFGITGAYSCSAGQQMILVAVGGNPGGGTNVNSALMAALGDCANLSASTFILMNEVTTVASVFALSPFMSAYNATGTSSTNVAGLARAFVSVNKLANIAGGTAGGPALPAGAVAPVAEINTLANVIAACVNSTGGNSGDGTTCGKLFQKSTPAGGTAPSDTVGALINMARNPTLNVAAIHSLVTAAAPFAPGLATPPSDWTMSIRYGGLHAPKTTVVDADGQVWVAQSGTNSVAVLGQTGSVLRTLSGNGLSGPSAIALDFAGKAWVTNSAGNSVSVFNADGTSFASALTGNATISAPTSLAFDASNYLWIANSGNNSVTELSPSGAYVKQVTGVDSPSAVVVDVR